MAATLNHGPITVAATATLILASNVDRVTILIQNLGSVDIYVGTSAVTTANGVKIAAGGSLGGIVFTGALYGIAASSTANVRYFEEAT